MAKWSKKLLGLAAIGSAAAGLVYYLKKSKKKTIEYEMVRNYRTEKMLLEDINKIFINVDKKVECFNYKENV